MGKSPHSARLPACCHSHLPLRVHPGTRSGSSAACVNRRLTRLTVIAADSLQLLQMQTTLVAARPGIKGHGARRRSRTAYRLIRASWQASVPIWRTHSNPIGGTRRTTVPGDRQQNLERLNHRFWQTAGPRCSHWRIADGEKAAQQLVATTLSAQQATISNSVARLPFHNNPAEEQAVARVAAIYSGVERNIHAFLVGAMLADDSVTS